jgi:hypothetical protein
MKPSLVLTVARFPLLAVAGWTFGITSILLNRSKTGFWSFTDEDPLHFLFWIAMGTGALLGFVVFLSSRMEGWREYMIHRGVSRQSLFRHLFGVAAVGTAATLFGSLALSFLLARAFSENGQLMSPDAMLRAAALFTSGFSGLALTAYVFTLSGSRVGAIVRGNVAVCVVIGGSYLLLTPPYDAFAAPIGRFLAFHVMAFAFFGTAACAAYLRDLDLDLPTPLPRLRVDATVTAITLAAVGCLLIALVQSQIAKSVLGDTLLAQDEPGGAYVVARRMDDGSWLRLDAEHRPLDGGRSRAAPARTSPRLFETPFQPTPLVKRWFPRRTVVDHGLVFGDLADTIYFAAYERAYLRRPAGYVEVLRYALPDSYGEAQEREGTRTVLVKSDGGRFSMRTEVIGIKGPLGVTPPRGESGQVLLGDPHDGTLWRLELSTVPMLLEIRLPEGDRYRDWETRDDFVRARDDRHTGRPEEVVIVGEFGRYVLSTDYVPSPAGAVASSRKPIASPLARPEFDMRIDDGDALHFRATIRDAEGIPLFEHDYAPYTAREKAAAASIAALAVLRPPALLLGGFVAAPPPSRPLYADPVFDPLVRARNGTLTLIAALVVAALVMRRAASVLRRRGAERGRIVLWCALLAICGPLGYLAFVLLEPARAWRMAPEAREPLRSAA